jgi:hypothetical protein
MISRTFDYSFEQLQIQFSDIELMLGYEPGYTTSLIASSIGEVMMNIKDYCSIAGGYFIFNDPVMTAKSNMLTISNIDLHVRRIVFAQVRLSTQIAIFCCSAGRKISDWSKLLIAEKDLIKGYIVDVMGTLIVESAMMMMQVELITDMNAAGLKTTNRYSPGYCGWDASERRKLFSVFPEDFCGVALTDNAQMDPAKSLSGIIGIGKKVHFNPYRCGQCKSSNCIYRTQKIQSYMSPDDH